MSSALGGGQISNGQRGRGKRWKRHLIAYGRIQVALVGTVVGLKYWWGLLGLLVVNVLPIAGILAGSNRPRKAAGMKRKCTSQPLRTAYVVGAIATSVGVFLLLFEAPTPGNLRSIGAVITLAGALAFAGPLAVLVRQGRRRRQRSRKQ